MQCYTELLPPSGVTHALSIPFISSSSNNLVVAKTSLLQIFSLVDSSSDLGSVQSEEKLKQDRSQATKLVLIAEHTLPGTVASLGKVKIIDSKSGGEAILVACRHAKLSLIEWDPDRHEISTISIHYYEGEDSSYSPWVPDLKSCVSHLTVDPSSRCAALNFGIRNLAILPFHQPGDDLVMDDFDPELDGERPDHEMTGVEEKAKEGDSQFQTPYASSFVLPLTALDPSLLHPISLGFLYEYREPTFGILYSQIATSSALLHERKDIVFYSVFTLDLEQRASTTLLSVPRLPSDLSQVVPLPPPVGGALLIGANAIVHVDQAGKTNAVGVNEFSRQASTFSMVDQSDLGMFLERCTVEQLGSENGDMLLVLSTGETAIIRFKLDGRSVSGLSIHRISERSSGPILKSSTSCSASLGRGRIFFGSEEADSILLGWSSSSASGKKSRAPVTQDADELMDMSDEDDAYEDDLYSTSVATSARDDQQTAQDENATGDYNFRLHDKLWTLGPMRDVTLGQPARPTKESEDIPTISGELELVVSQGSGYAGGLAILQREIDPILVDTFKVEDAQGVWSVSVRGSKSESQRSDKSPDRYLIVSKYKASDKEESVVYSMSSGSPQEVKAPEFNPIEDCTIDIGTLSGGSRIVQALKTEVRSYDSDLGLAQIYPIWDEDTSDERTVLSASFSDPFLSIIRDDSTLLVLQSDESGDIDEISYEGEAQTNKWISGALYEDKHGFFMPLKQAENGSLTGSILLFLLSSEGKLFIFILPNLNTPIYVVEGVDILLPVLSSESLPKRNNARETVAEITVANLGDLYHELPYLILRTASDDIVLYRPFHSGNGDGKPIENLRFSRILNHELPKTPVDGALGSSTGARHQRSQLLRVLPNVGGFSAVAMTGSSSCFIMKHASSQPHVQSLRGKSVYSLSSFSTDTNTDTCVRGFVFVDADGVVRTCRLRPETRFESSWASRKVNLKSQVDGVVYCPKSEVYALGVSRPADFKLPEDDETHPEWRNEVISFLPRTDRGSVEILSPKTWTVVDSFALGADERIMSIKNLSLEVSELTHERKDMVVVGTAIVRGEDVASKGCIYVFEVIHAVPEPEKPETDRKLKLFAKELVKGSVTALSSIGGQGFLLAAQGQKCMVRGLKEDGSLLPVAFMDMQCYVSVAKELKGTGLCLMGDAVNGLWFAGYSEEPYKMTLFGKDSAGLEVIAAEFLPDGKQLHILVADGDGTIHVLQYDPEDPKSSKGDRLLHRSTFHAGHFMTNMTLLPRTAISSELAYSNSDEMETDSSSSPHQVLITSQTGSIGIVTTVSEETYRRFSALQSQLINTLEHPCGLNPRAYRAVESDGITGRGMIDGSLVYRWLDLGMQRRMEIASRVGADIWQIRADLESIGAAGLGYL